MNKGRLANVDVMQEIAQDLRALGDIRAPSTVAPKVMTSLALGDTYCTIDVPTGTLYVAHNSLGISAVSCADSDQVFEYHLRLLHGRPAYREDGPPTWLINALSAWQNGRRAANLKFDLRGVSPFAQTVLRKSLEIPLGEVRTYSWIAREIGYPRAVRAAGSALARNPIPFFIPCHRVVRSDGHIGQYSLGGAAIKKAVLAQEHVDIAWLETLAQRGVRYVASASTHIYCFPTCRHARRIGEAHRVLWRSAQEAQDAAYRPCKVCRPGPPSLYDL